MKKLNFKQRRKQNAALLRAYEDAQEKTELETRFVPFTGHRTDIYRDKPHASQRAKTHRKQKNVSVYEDKKPRKHAVVTPLQLRILLTMDGCRLSTYQIAKQLKADFWKIKDALKVMWDKGFITCDNRLWRAM